MSYIGLRKLTWAYSCVLFACLAAWGCGSDGNASISGKVSYNGAPVTGGSLIFLPDGHQGKTAEAEIQADGSYRASAANSGKHKVNFSPASAVVELQPGENPPPGPFDGLGPKQVDVEIKGGSNKVDVELIKPTPPPG